MKSLFKTLLITLTFLGFTASLVFAAPAYNTFRTVTYTGNGAYPRSITGLGFKPDLVWLKGRSAASSHILTDSVRGAGKFLSTNTYAAEVTADVIGSLDEDGFTMTSGSSYSNASGVTYVAWCWEAGGDAVSNTNGNITSSVSANPDAGFSIVGYTGNGTAGATIGHGLNSAPDFMIVRNYNYSRNWAVYHSGIGETKTLLLDTILAAGPAPTYWNNTSPDATTFTVGSADQTNMAGYKYIAYCFTEKPGVSAFGKYTGNGSANGPEIECGFKPAWIMIKRADAGSSWTIVDAKRGINPSGGSDAHLLAESTNPEASYDYLSITDTGFKITQSETTFNNSGAEVIYMAFAENEAPSISFSSDVSSIDHSAEPPESATLSWNVSYADSVVIEPGIGQVDPTGSVSVAPSSPTTYTLTVTVGEDTFTQEVFLNVTNSYSQAGVFTVDGKVGIGVLNPVNALEVNGTIKAREVIVTNDGWADYVFSDNYNLPQLSSVENHIKTYRHLPGIPTADQIGTDGLSVSRMLELQMQKIEELTLYIIELSKENQRLEQRLNAIE